MRPITRLAALVLALTLLLTLTACTKDPVPPTDPATIPTETTPAPTETQPAPTESTEPPTTLPAGVEFPYSLADGALTVDSLFQYSGLNVDCNMADGTNTGAVAVTNNSELTLKDADLVLALYDGTQLHFLIREIPAGATVWAFELENKQFADNNPCMELSAGVAFHEEPALLQGPVTAQTGGMVVTLTNETAGSLDGLFLACHNSIDGIILGGLPYTYEVGSLANGESKDVFCADCFLGDALPCWLGTQDTLSE